MHIVWLASHPKSGNTWVRFLLHNYLFGPARSSAELDQRLPDIHRSPIIRTSRPIGLFVKSHFALTDQHPYLKQTAGIIYILRHPKDVLLSNIDYFKLFGEAGVEPRQYIQQWIDLAGDPTWHDKGFGTWAEHVESWLSFDRAPKLLIRYEDLKLDTESQLRRMLTFLDQPIDESRIAGAVESSRLESLQQMERADKQRGSSIFPGSAEMTDRGRMFFNKARTGSSLAHIDPELDAQFDRRFEKALAALGYAAPITA